MLRFPITALIMVLNIIYFVYAKWMADQTGQYPWGIFDKVRFAEGEWHLMLTATFTHLDFIHLFFNLISIYLFCSVLEQLTARWKYLLLYLGGGCLAYLCVYAFSNNQFTVGASGAVFAAFGALYYLTRSKPHLFDAGSRTTLNMIIFLNVVTTFLISNVSISGHLGGLIAGFISARILRIDEH